MRVDRLTLQDFTVFAEADFEFSPGLNVLIGANGTGKSHVLKVLYSVARSVAGDRQLVASNSDDRAAQTPLGVFILEGLRRTFRPEPARAGLIALVRHGARTGKVAIATDCGSAAVGLGETAAGETAADTNFQNPLPAGGPAVFLPTGEVLSMYPGFAAAYERRELSFDETYRDVCVDLSASPLRSIGPPALEELVAKLDAAIGGKTVLRGDRFYVAVSEDWLLAAPMLAEGLRKLASITQLIRNGSIAEKSILFWDEPETNINPKLIPTVAQALLALAGAGVQVFVATHDYLLSDELSLAAEYQTNGAKQAATRFFALSRTDRLGAVAVEWGRTLAELHHNPILDEYAAHYDREQALFNASPSVAGEGEPS